MTQHGAHWSNSNCMWAQEVAVEKYIFKACQPGCLENPLASGELLRGLQSHPLAENILFFLDGRRNRKHVLWSGLPMPACPCPAGLLSWQDTSAVHGVSLSRLYHSVSPGGQQGGWPPHSYICDWHYVCTSPSQPVHKGRAEHSCLLAASDLHETNIPSLAEAPSRGRCRTNTL